MLLSLRIEPEGTTDFGRCPCCGDVSRRIWGTAYADGLTYAAYSVHWTVNRVFEHGAHFDFVIGRWGEGTSADDRSVVALDYRVVDDGPGFMVIDAATRQINMDTLASRRLSRAEVIGTPLAENVFALCDAIFLQDARTKALDQDA